jgi:hypothetical protein
MEEEIVDRFENQKMPGHTPNTGDLHPVLISSAGYG